MQIDITKVCGLRKAIEFFQTRFSFSMAVLVVQCRLDLGLCFPVIEQRLLLPLFFNKRSVSPLKSILYVHTKKKFRRLSTVLVLSKYFLHNCYIHFCDLACKSIHKSISRQKRNCEDIVNVSPLCCQHPVHLTKYPPLSNLSVNMFVYEGTIQVPICGPLTSACRL